MKRNKLVIVSLLIAIALPVVAWSEDALSGEQPSLTFGIVPQQTASKLLQSWGPLLKWLTRRTGYKIQFKTAPDIPAFESRTLAGEYDIAYMNPYHFTVFNRTADYQAIARARGKSIHGILVVHKDSKITSLDDLEGEKVAFPAPAAFAATVLPRANLAARGIQIHPQYVSSHDSVYRAVARDFYPAGGGVIRTLESTAPATRDNLRILWKSPGYTPHAIAVHSRVPAHQVREIQQALVELHEYPEGKALLERLKISGFQTAADSDWNDVRALNIGALLGKAD